MKLKMNYLDHNMPKAMIIKKIFAASVFLSVLVFSSCSKFLEESSQDLEIPKTVKDYKELIFGEAYMRDDKFVAQYLDIMTDDVTSFYGKPKVFKNDTREHGYGYYTWQQQPEYGMSSTRYDDGAWLLFYNHILTCNIVLNDMDKIIGQENEKQLLIGECNLIRAYSYFMLVNLFADVYDKSNAGSMLGVPLNNLTYIDDVRYTRATVEETYREITSNLESGIENFEKTSIKNSIFRWNTKAAYLFASRVYLYMQEYEKTIEYATKLIQMSPALYDLNIKYKNDLETPFLNQRNPEILYTYGYYSNSYFAYAANGCFPASESLKKVYGKGDLRFDRKTGAFLRERGGFFGKQYTHFKNDGSNITKVYGYALRVAEAYLNRAEAYIMMNQVDKAMADINFLRSFRISKEQYKPLQASSKEEALNILKDESRRELCYENLRWFNLRRWGKPEITHVFMNEYEPLTTTTWVLKEKDAAYVLPIPVYVLNSQDMISNDRPERKAIE